MKDGEIHVMAALGSVLLSAALVVPSVMLGDASADTGPALDNMESIEASLAYKKPNAPKQPQKPKHAPDPTVKPEGVSHDADKKPDDKKPDDKKDDKKPSKDTDPLAKFRRTQDDDSDVGKPNETVGAFDGSEFGIGDVTKGDPYFQRLVVDLGWQAPELAKSSGTPPIGCIHLTADGKIADTKFKEKSDDDVASLAEGALHALQKKRNDHPEEVPTHLLKQLTTRWVCFKFTVKSSE